HLADGGALGDLAFLTDDAGDAAELAGHAFVELDDLVEGVGDLAVHAVEVDGEAGGEVALLEGEKGGQQFSPIEGPAVRMAAAVAVPTAVGRGSVKRGLDDQRRGDGKSGRTVAAGAAARPSVAARRGDAVGTGAVTSGTALPL